MENEKTLYSEKFIWNKYLSNETKQMLWEILRMACPNILTLIIISLFDTFIYRFVGQKSPLSLASFAIGYSIVRLTSVSYILGINCAIDTLISQYFGMKNYYKCAIFLYLGIIFCNLFATISFIISLFSYEMLMFFGVEESIAGGASIFAKHSIIFVYFILNFDVLKRMLNAQKIVNPQFYISMINGFLQIIHSYFFIKYFDFLGAIYSMSLTNFLNVVFILIYFFYTGTGNRIVMIVKFEDLLLAVTEYLSVAIPGGINFGIESLSYHILNLFSATLSVMDSATNAILMNLDYIYFYFGTGAGSAICALVGNSLGENKGLFAKYYAFMGFIFFAVLSFLLGIIFFLFKNSVGHFFTSDESIFSNFNSYILIATISMVFDSIQAGCNRVLAGMGFQKYASIVILIMYFPIMVPTAYFLKSRWQLGGIWIPYIFTFIVISIFDFLLIFLTDYTKLASKITIDIENCSGNIKKRKNSDEELKNKLLTNNNIN